jgi:pyruvate formate lyase activating enzyme
MTGKIYNIQPFSTTDGPGVRTVVFFQGCNQRCAWCHNPESWELDPAPAFLAEKCIGCGRCDDLCPAGAIISPCRTFTPQELWAFLAVDAPYFESGGGITFSGGEALLQADFLKEIISICRENGIHTAVDTAGHVPYENFTKANPDLFLYDIKAVSAQAHLELTGVDGILIWENLARLLAEGREVCVRVPCVPGANFGELPAIGEKLRSLGVKKIEALPYHRLGEGKAAMYGLKQRTFDVPDEAEIKWAEMSLRL